MDDFLDGLDDQIKEKRRASRNAKLVFLVYIVAWGFFVYWVVSGFLL